MIDYLKLAYLSGAKLAQEDFLDVLDDSHGALEGLADPRGSYPDVEAPRASPGELAKRYQTSMSKNKRAIHMAHQGELEGQTPISERIPGTNRRGATWWHW
jgi:hypothetical protein